MGYVILGAELRAQSAEKSRRDDSMLEEMYFTSSARKKGLFWKKTESRAESVGCLDRPTDFSGYWLFDRPTDFSGIRIVGQVLEGRQYVRGDVLYFFRAKEGPLLEENRISRGKCRMFRPAYRFFGILVV